MHVTHQHFYAAAPAPAASSAPPPAEVVAAQVAPAEVALPEASQGTQKKKESVATDEQREVLRLLRELDEPLKAQVRGFMRREFRTSMVVQLTSGEVFRTRRYIETVREARSATTAKKRGKNHEIHVGDRIGSARGYAGLGDQQMQRPGR
ncbi:hypothetical protein [Paracidovorax cattleyae]|uniref:hypothetical protein n=1 Tax=Paracidovorax cattleyae TaxID=80868 RepID=UPI0018AFB87D|nr:hypothetical protein [Paracidovorax cattleyae]MBF9263582.1 hypothetical protein [Paracidovorax cattleyae]